MSVPMTNLERYARHLFPDTVRCLGVRLQPLCIGHVMLLQRLGSPLATGGRIPDAVDVALAVAICSKPFATARRWTRSSKLRIWLRLALLSWAAAARPAQRDILARYLRDGIMGPKWWAKKRSEADEAPGTPFWIFAQVTLMRELGLSLDGALSIPISQALWYCLAVWESGGGVSLASDTEQDLMAEEAAR